MVLPENRASLNVPSFRNTAEKLHLQKRFKLKTNSQLDMNFLWAETTEKNVNTDALLGNSQDLTSALSKLKKSQTDITTSHILGLKSQGLAIKCVLENILERDIVSWIKTLDKLPNFIHNFAREAMQQMLPTAANLTRWGKIADPTCRLCNNGSAQTNKHVLSNCSAQVALKRYTKRHNDVLQLLADWLLSNRSKDYSLHADIESNKFKRVC